MAIKEDDLLKKTLKKFLKNPLEALKFYASPNRVKWYINKKSGKLPSMFPADNMRILPKIKKAIIKKVTADGITKNCIITNSNFSFTTNKIKIKKKDMLSFSIRLNKEIKGSILFRVTVNKDIIFLRKISIESFKTMDWLDINLDLNKYKNKDIKIKFSTEDESKKNSKESIIWSEPIILNKNQKKTNIILISLDCCRKDHLSCYGYYRKTTPNIDKLNTIKFDNVFSQTVWTDHSHKVMFTSLYPITQRWYEKTNKKIIFLSEILRNNGYITYSNNGATRLGPEIINKGFDYFIYKKLDRKNNISSAEDIINSSIKFIKSINENPFFMFLHFMEAHEPYDIPNPYHFYFNKNYTGDIDIHTFKTKLKKGEINIKGLSKKDINYLIGLYDAGIKYFDEEIGKLINFLKNNNTHDNTLIIITADHAEEFMEHGYLYHYKFYDETINVPLIIKLPKGFNKKNINKKAMIELIDISPTIMKIIGLKSLKNMQGKSVFNKKESDLAFSEHWTTESNKRFCFSIRSNKFKYIYTKNMKSKEVTEELYDITKDSKEKNNIADKNKKIIRLIREEKENYFKKNERI